MLSNKRRFRNSVPFVINPVGIEACLLPRMFSRYVVQMRSLAELVVVVK